MGKQNICVSIFLTSILGFYHVNSLLIDPSSYSCTPLRYDFKLDFSGTCPPKNKAYNGIKFLDCEMRISEKVEGDIAPVVLDSLVLTESATEGDGQTENINAQMKNGLEIQYNSLTLYNSQIFVTSLIINAEGTNINNETVKMFVLIDFDQTSCGVEPFDDLKSLGWLFIETTTPARRSTCECPTFLPSFSPTNTVSNIPSNKASTEPSISASSTLSNIPSNKPSTNCKSSKSEKCGKSNKPSKSKSKSNKSSKSKSKKSKSQVQPKSSKSKTKNNYKSKSPKSNEKTEKYGKKYLRLR